MNSRSIYLNMRVLSGAICTLAIIVLLWPMPKLTTQFSAEPIIETEQNSYDIALSTDEARTLFDFTRLPSPKQPETPPAPAMTIDPAAAIKRHRLLGITINENEAVALLTDGTHQITLKRGDNLANFTVTHIRPREVVFEKGGVVAALSLP